MVSHNALVQMEKLCWNSCLFCCVCLSTCYLSFFFHKEYIIFEYRQVFGYKKKYKSTTYIVSISLMCTASAKSFPRGSCMSASFHNQLDILYISSFTKWSEKVKVPSLVNTHPAEGLSYVHFAPMKL